jgi:hypothetical protein
VILECEGNCGRTLVDGRWGFWDVGAHRKDAICPSCLKARRDAAEQLYRREFWAAQRRKAMRQCRNYVADPFQGFREESK